MTLTRREKTFGAVMTISVIVALVVIAFCIHVHNEACVTLMGDHGKQLLLK